MNFCKRLIGSATLGLILIQCENKPLLFVGKNNSIFEAVKRLFFSRQYQYLTDIILELTKITE